MKITTSIIDALDEWWGKTGEYARVTNAWLEKVAEDKRYRPTHLLGFFCYEDHT